MTDEREDKPQRRRWAVGWYEIGLVGASVAVFFVFLTALLGFYFPEGTAIEGDRREWSPLADAMPDIGYSVGDDDIVDTEFFVGRILGIQRRVQHREAESLTWNNASVGEAVQENDAVQTFTRSTALLEINETSRLTLGQNSLIVFDQHDADPFLSNRGSVLVMINGELSGSLTAERGTRFNFGITLPNSGVTLVRDDPNEDVDFLISVNDDQSTTVNLYAGSARIVGKNGVEAAVRTNEAATIDSSGTRIEISDLPLPPNTTSPGHNRSVVYRNVPKPVSFAWTQVEAADRYHIVVSRDEDFTDLIVDDDVIGTTFEHGALPPGSYYWFVRSRSAWTQSPMSEVRRLNVHQDNRPPALDLAEPPKVVAIGEWRLRGQTDSNAQLFVNETPITHDNGRIDYPVELQPGANIIVVKAMDRVGNLNYASVSVIAKQAQVKRSE